MAAPPPRSAIASQPLLALIGRSAVPSLVEVGMGAARGFGFGLLAALALLGFSCSSDDDDAAPAAGDAAVASGAGKSGAAAAAAAGAGATSGSAGTRPGTGGNSNAGASGGGGAGNDAGKPVSFPIAGSGTGGTPADAGFPSDLEGSCTTAADCELCTGPLGPADPCCPGCPLVSSKTICAQLNTAFSMCRTGGRIGLCPQVSCVAPGSPGCSREGKCVMGNGLEH